MSLLGLLNDWWSRESASYVVHDVPASSVQPAADVGAPCTAGVHYFRIWLAEMRLAHDQRWFTSRHPAVHSVVRLRFGDQEIELPRISGPLALPGLDEAHLGDVVHFDHPLTPLLPYNGGVVELSAGLLALEGTNVLKEFVSAIDTVSQVLVQPPLSLLLGTVGPVTRAVQTLLGVSNGRQHLGVHVAYAGEAGAPALHAGWLAVIRRGAAVVDPADLTVVQGRLRYRGVSIGGADYLLFRIERMVERDDWDSLTSIARPFGDALTAMSHGNTVVADALVRRAVLEAFTSPDLTRADRPRVAGEIKRVYQDARQAGLGLQRDPITLAGAMAGAVPVAQSMLTQPPSIGALLELEG